MSCGSELMNVRLGLGAVRSQCRSAAKRPPQVELLALRGVATTAGGTPRAARSSAAFSGARGALEAVGGLDVQGRPLCAGAVLAARALLPPLVELLALRGVAPRRAAQGVRWRRAAAWTSRAARSARAQCSQREHCYLCGPAIFLRQTATFLLQADEKSGPIPPVHQTQSKQRQLFSSRRHVCNSKSDRDLESKNLYEKPIPTTPQ